MIKKEQLKNLKNYSKQMDNLCYEMEKQLIEIVKEHGNLIRTDNVDNDTMFAIVLDEENYRFVEKKILAITTQDEYLKILVDDFNVFAGDETDEEILAYNGWYCTGDELLPAPTLWSICDYLREYIDDVEYHPSL